MNPSFTALTLRNGLLYSDEYDGANVYGVNGQQFFHCEKGTYFAFVYRGVAWANSEFPIYKGMYACLNSGFLQTDAYCQALIVQAPNYKGMRSFGGPIEREGRLKYIDGCTDSLLVPPVKLGDPCLNHLHFPPDISQTMHTHPSVRIGMVFKGNGECVTPWGNIPLVEGMAFIIHPENSTLHEGKLVGSHCFRTGDNSMDVIAYHPDSDFGPTDEEHPMLNRTMVEGVSAKHIEKIRTK
jgi:hypothetical protein